LPRNKKSKGNYSRLLAADSNRGASSSYKQRKEQVAMESNEPTVAPELEEEALHRVTGAASGFGWSHLEQIGLGVGATTGAIATGPVAFEEAKKSAPQHTGLVTAPTTVLGLVSGGVTGYIGGSLYKDMKGTRSGVNETTPLIRR
jgi:hypothetical protein